MEYKPFWERASRGQFLLVAFGFGLTAAAAQSVFPWWPQLLSNALYSLHGIALGIYLTKAD